MICARAAFEALREFPSIARLEPVIAQDWPCSPREGLAAAAVLAGLIPCGQKNKKFPAVGVAQLPGSNYDYIAFRKGGHWWIPTRRGHMRIRDELVYRAWCPRELRGLD